ncbi:MAG: BrnT family toxin [Oceanicaulis sp.]|nr:BrnT family toxin [Oceanicaulis sp.]
MQFEWDEAKDRANRAKHGIGFDEAAGLFFGDYVLIPARSGPGGEARWKAVGPLRGRPVIAVVHTDRSGRVRIMSARTASRKERRRYYGTHDQGQS